jgi:hypothetical protein
MEGRETKHIAIRRYSQNINFHGRWMQIFRHEFVHLIWLRLRGYEVGEIYKRKEVYVPVGVTCYCGFPKQVQEKCSYFSHQYRTSIETCVRLGKVVISKALLQN